MEVFRLLGKTSDNWGHTKGLHSVRKVHAAAAFNFFARENIKSIFTREKSKLPNISICIFFYVVSLNTKEESRTLFKKRGESEKPEE